MQETVFREFTAYQAKSIRTVQPLGQGQPCQHREELKFRVAAQTSTSGGGHIPDPIVTWVAGIHECHRGARVEEQHIIVGQQGAAPYLVSRRDSEPVLLREEGDDRPPQADVIHWSSRLS